jgi:hypothetical protein
MCVQHNLGMMVVSNRVGRLTAENHPCGVMKPLLIALSLTCSHGLAKAEEKQTFPQKPHGWEQRLASALEIGEAAKERG